MKNLSSKEILSLLIASKYKRLAISFGYDPKTLNFIPVFGNKKSPALLTAFSYAESIKDFAEFCKKERFEIHPDWKEISLSGRLDQIVYGD